MSLHYLVKLEMVVTIALFNWFVAVSVVTHVVYCYLWFCVVSVMFVTVSVVTHLSVVICGCET